MYSYIIILSVLMCEQGVKDSVKTVIVLFMHKVKTAYRIYSEKYWRALLLAKQPSKTIGEFI